MKHWRDKPEPGIKTGHALTAIINLNVLQRSSEMSKRSAADKLIARIDADIAAVNSVVDYVGKDGSEALGARIDADLARFNGMRDYVTASIPTAATDSAKPARKTRGKGKKAAAAVEDGAVQS